MLCAVLKQLLPHDSLSTLPIHAEDNFEWTLFPMYLLETNYDSRFRK